MWKTLRNRWKTTVWARENHSCSIKLLYCVGKRVSLVQCTIRCSSSKERHCFLPYSLINFLLFSQKIYLGFCPNSLATCSSYSLRNMAEYKNRCQVIIFLFWTLLQLRYYLVAGGERMPTSALWHEGGWLCHYMGNNSWAMRGTSKVLQMIHVSLKWSNIHSANEGCFYSTWP